MRSRDFSYKAHTTMGNQRHNTQAVALATQYLFASVDEMRAAQVPVRQMERLLRWRDAYTHWLGCPDDKIPDIVRFITGHFGVSISTAYDDARTVQTLIGELNRHSREFHRWRFIEMIGETFQMARDKEDPRAMAMAAATFAKATQLDRPEEDENPLEGLRPQPFAMSDDPTLLGYRPVENLRERIQKFRVNAAAEIQDVQYEEVDQEEYAKENLPE